MTGFELFTTVLGIIRTVCAIVFWYIKSGVNDIKRSRRKRTSGMYRSFPG